VESESHFRIFMKGLNHEKGGKRECKEEEDRVGNKCEVEEKAEESLNNNTGLGGNLYFQVSSSNGSNLGEGTGGYGTAVSI